MSEAISSHQHVLFRVSDELARKRASGKTKVREEGHCRMCGRRGSEELQPQSVRFLTRHHLVPRRWFRRHPLLQRLYANVDANIVPLCRPCHDMVECDLGARRMLRHVLTQAEIAFCIQLRGEEWLEHRYPLRALAHPVDLV